METEEQGRIPTVEEARAALESAGRARAAVDEVVAPKWFIVALGVWVMPLGLLGMAPSNLAGGIAVVAGLLVWMALFSVIVKRGFGQMGVVGSFRWQAATHVTVILMTASTAAALVAVLIGGWAWPLFSLFEGLMIMLYGMWVRAQTVRKAA